MPRARKELVEADQPGYYHVYTKCVRGAFLCGHDPDNDRSCRHRKTWIEQRLAFLVSLFAIDILEYSIMDNHDHLGLYVDPQRVQQWSQRRVAELWLQLHPPRDGYRRPMEVTEQDIQNLYAQPERIEQLRAKLGDLSTFMAELNQWIARKANAKDEAPGRFHSRRLLDPAAIAACCCYVALNPIRAQLAETPEESEHTGIQRRIRAQRARPQPARDDVLVEEDSGRPADHWLMPIQKTPAQDRGENATPGGPFFMTAEQYIALVDWTGRQIRADKCGAIPPDLAPILQRLDLEPDRWLRQMQSERGLLGSAIGRAAHLAAEAARRNAHRLRNAMPELFARIDPEHASAAG
jgi:hypothetical protein